MKRDGNEDMTVHEEGDIFTVFMSDQLFRNDIKHEQCGTDNYTGDTTHNKDACEKLLEDVVNQVKRRITKSFTEMQDRKRQISNPLLAAVQPVVQRYSTYSRFHAFASYEKDTTLLKDRLQESLKNSLVSKAYADEGCYLRCTKGQQLPYSFTAHQFGDDLCRAGCYEPTEAKFEALYGLDPWKSLEAESSPWNLAEDKIINASYEAHSRQNPIGFLPGAFPLNPYERTPKDETPLLPVCKSDLLTLHNSWPCSCGNLYGDETELFLSAANWGEGHKDYGYAVIGQCINSLQPLVHSNPAAFLINMCNVVYKGIARPGSGSHQEMKNKGHYKENYNACQMYWRYYNDNKDLSDGTLNSDMCKLWSKFYKDRTRGANHGHKSFSYVNDALENGGCHPWKNFWKHDCKKGRRKGCDFPAGYRRPTTTDGLTNSFSSASDLRTIQHEYDHESRMLRKRSWDWDWSD